jgi:outer membrane immunogenic protein
MKKLVLALAAATAFTGSALAADMAPAPAYVKGPAPIMPVYNWTGFYVFGGAGGGIWDAGNTAVNASGVTSVNQRMGGDGWLGTAGAGYDWQFNRSWVAGVFADGMFGNPQGSINDALAGTTGNVKLRDTWAAGARVGILVAPNVLSYVNAGYTGSQWSSASLTSVLGGAVVATTPSFNRNGWFIGGGVENNLDIFGITAPGLFLKTEYRAAYFNSATLPETFAGTTTLTGFSSNFNKPLVQTVTTSLVYRFNWGGPVVANY